MTEKSTGRGDAGSRAPDIDPNDLTIWEELAQRSWLGPRMRLCIRHVPTGIEVKQRDLRMTSYTARRVLIAELSEKVAEDCAMAPASTAQSIATKAKELADMVCKSLNQAWHLGQTYWQQADSEYASQNRKSDETQAAYQALVDETRAALLFGGYALPSVEHNAPPMPQIKPARDAHGFVWQHSGDSTPRPHHYVSPKSIPFQARVQPWMLECFGAEIAADAIERNHRFFEEAAELVQACGMTASEAHQLVDYVYGRPAGEKLQEIGGVMVTLAALCLAQGEDMHDAGETELARVWTKVEQIRAKQAAKPKHSPLPEHPAVPQQTEPIVPMEVLRVTYAPDMTSEEFARVWPEFKAWQQNRAAQSGKRAGVTEKMLETNHDLIADPVLKHVESGMPLGDAMIVARKESAAPTQQQEAER